MAEDATEPPRRHKSRIVRDDDGGTVVKAVEVDIVELGSASNSTSAIRLSGESITVVPEKESESPAVESKSGAGRSTSKFSIKRKTSAADDSTPVTITRSGTVKIDLKKHKTRAEKYHDMCNEAWLRGVPLMMIKRTRVQDPSEVPPDMSIVRNEHGDYFQLERYPWKRFPKDHKPGDYGASVAIILFLRFQLEAAVVFLLMFVLSIGAIVTNNQRFFKRYHCRKGLQTPEDYAVLTGAEGVTQSMISATRTLLGFDPAMCGWEGLPIRPLFDRNVTDPATNTSVFSPSITLRDIEGSGVFASSGLGGCEEYKDRPPPGCSHCNTLLLQPDPLGLLDSDSGSLMIDTPKSAYCFIDIDYPGWSEYTGQRVNQWCQLLAIGVFVAFLIRLRWLSQRAAKEEDRAVISTADFALKITGLDTTNYDADELKEQVRKDIEQLDGGRFAGDTVTGRPTIHHIEVGRHCRVELKLMKKLAQLDVRASEADAQLDWLEEEGNTASRTEEKLMEELKEINTQYDVLRKELEGVVSEKDKATGDAYIVFQLEEDRNACGNMFLGPMAERPMLGCASKEPPPRPSCLILLFNLVKMAFGRQGDRDPLCDRPLTRMKVKSAPEPDEVLWQNLERDDAYMEKIEFRGSVLLLFFLLLGLAALAASKALQVYVKNFLVTRDDDFTADATTAINTCVTILVAIVTNLVNDGLRKYILYLVNKESRDTITEEQASIFSKLSVAYIANTVLVPLILQIYFSLGGTTLIDQSWYENGGVVSHAFVLTLVNMVTDLLKVAPPTSIINKYILARKARSQPQLDWLFRPEPMDLGMHYSYTVKTVTLGLVFGPLFPPIYFITVLALCVAWFCTRVGMRAWYKKPPNVDQKMMLELRLRLGHVLGLSILIQCFANYTLQGNGGFQTSGIVIIGGPILAITYYLLPLWMFKDMRMIDELYVPRDDPLLKSTSRFTRAALTRTADLGIAAGKKTLSGAKNTVQMTKNVGVKTFEIGQTAVKEGALAAGKKTVTETVTGAVELGKNTVHTTVGIGQTTVDIGKDVGSLVTGNGDGKAATPDDSGKHHQAWDLDTMGLEFDDVERRSGIPLESYVCPKLGEETLKGLNMLEMSLELARRADTDVVDEEEEFGTKVMPSKLSKYLALPSADSGKVAQSILRKRKVRTRLKDRSSLDILGEADAQRARSRKSSRRKFGSITSSKGEAEEVEAGRDMEAAPVAEPQAAADQNTE